MLDSLLYVSRSTLFMPDDERTVHEIVRQAQIKNQRLQLSGALLFTHQHFAQFLEGSEANIADLMASIRQDPRHADIRIVASRRTATRRFSDWSMGYAGPSELVGDRVEAAFASGFHGATSLASERLIRLMLDFAQPSPEGRNLAA